MDVISLQSRVQLMQLALRSLTLLHLASYLWPEDAVVTEDSCYDFIIVGGGTAGCILASRLIETGLYTVLLIEAGGDPPIESLYPGTFSYLPRSENDWNFITINDGYTAQEHRGNIIELTSGKMLGGDSSLGHLIYHRGDPYDYNRWADIVKDKSWNYENLLPYFKKNENLKDKAILESPYIKFHGTRGRMGLTRETHIVSKKYLKAFKQTGHEILLDGEGDHTLGYFEPLFMIKDGIRQSTAYTHISPFRYHPNLSVMKNTEVTEIVFNGNTAIGVKAVKDQQMINIRARREVIVSAGTIKSAQLLMLSGIGPADQLETYNIPIKSELPVGKKYQDHVGVIIAHKLNIIDAKSRPANPHEFILPLIIGNEALNRSQGYADYETMNYIVPSDSEEIISLCAVSSSFKDHICQSLYDQTKGSETMFTKLILSHPNSRGHVILESASYTDQPMIISDFFFHEEDLDNLVLYIEDFLRVTDSGVFKKYNAEFVKPDLSECNDFPGDVYWKCYALGMMASSYHYTSTCAMGSVVDSRLRVFGVDSLRVVGAPVIPVITGGNTQAAVMAIAEKAADMILEDNILLLPSNCGH